MNTPKLASHRDCTGCGACKSSCAKGAITFGYDRNGHLRPVVDSRMCVNCGLCVKHCPIVNDNKIIRHDPHQLTTYTSWTKNDDLCLHATSGGVFSQLAIDFLHKGNSKVYGAYLTDHNTCHHIGIDSPKDLPKIVGTKYIQSDASGVYGEIKQLLRKGMACLFCGTPCQIAGLYAYLQYVSVENLLTIELICHGVPSKLATDIACGYYDADHIISYRNKNTGHHKGFCCTYLKTSGQLVENQREEFFSRFFGSTDRPSCYRCKYARIERVSDISLGDQWGLHSKYPERAALGSNLVVCNTEKGRNALLESQYIESHKEANRTLNAPTLFMPITTDLSSTTPYLHYIIKLPKTVSEEVICMNWQKHFWLVPIKIIGFIERKIWSYRFKKTLIRTRKKYNWL